MISLAAPWALIALPLPVLARLLPRARQESGPALKVPFFAGVTRVSPEARQRASRLRLVVAILAWVLLVLAAARPQWIGAPIGLPIAGRDLMLAVDISGSMEQQDYELSGHRVSRLIVVQAVARRFIERRTHDRLGLILFGSQAYLQTPLTFDRDTVATMLGEAVVGLAGRETAIGDAIALAVKRLRSQPEGSRVLILLTDGQNTAGSILPEDAAKLAAQAKIRIYTIGIGGGSLSQQTFFGMRLVQPGDDFDPTTLQQIAKITGGRFFAVSAREQLEKVYDELDRLEPTAHDPQTYRPRHALFMWPATLALLLSIALVLGQVWPLSGRLARGSRHAD